MPTNTSASITYDNVADLLSTNNTLNVLALVGAFVFGSVAVYGIYLTWKHQRWERKHEECYSLNVRSKPLASP